MTRIFLLILFLAFPAFGEPVVWEGFFKGEIRKDLKVALTFREKKGELEGFYYYRSQGKDIPLKGKKVGKNGLTFKEYGKQGKLTGTWKGKIRKNFYFEGTWTGPKGKKKYPFSLYRVNRVSEPGLPEHREIIENGIGYQLLSVGKKGFEFPKLTQYEDKEVLALVNKKIETHVQGFGCPEGNRDSDNQLLSDVTYTKNKFFSIYASASYFCGTAYPTHGANSSITFDLHDGSQVLLNHLFHQEKENLKEAYGFIFKEFLETGEKLRREKPEVDDCQKDYSLDLFLDYGVLFHFADTGVVFQPEFPHALAACALPVTVPYKDMKRFSPKGGPLLRL